MFLKSHSILQMKTAPLARKKAVVAPDNLRKVSGVLAVSKVGYAE